MIWKTEKSTRHEQSADTANLKNERDDVFSIIQTVKGLFLSHSRRAMSAGMTCLKTALDLVSHARRLAAGRLEAARWLGTARTDAVLCLWNMLGMGARRLG